MITRTNLFPYPSAETTVGWGPNAGVSTTAVSTAAYSGTKCVQVQRDTGSGPISAYFGTDTSSNPNADSWAVTAGEVYTFSCYVMPGATSPSVQALLVYQTATTYQAFTAGTAQATVAGAWTRITVSGTVPAGAVKMGIEVRNSGGASLSAVAGWRMDGFQLEKSGSVSAWFDGAGNGALPGLFYSWAGTANASASYEDNLAPGRTVLLQDNFNRADNTTVLGSPQVGPAPTVPAGSVAGIISNQMYSSTGTLLAAYYDLGVAEVELTVTYVTSGSGGIGLIFGYTSATDQWYVFFSTTVVQIVQVMPSGTGLAHASETWKVLGPNSICKAHYSGGVIRGYVDGVLVVRWRPDIPLTATKCGIRLNHTSLRMDNMLGTDAPTVTDDKTAGSMVAISENVFGADKDSLEGYAYLGRDTFLQDQAAGA